MIPKRLSSFKPFLVFCAHHKRRLYGLRFCQLAPKLGQLVNTKGLVFEAYIGGR